MQDNKPDLALSRTFRLVGGELSAADQAEQWAQVLNIAGSQKLAPGEVVDSKYRVVALVGVGGMGSVYRVQHLLLGKEVALKTFNTSDMTADAWQRFQREAIAIAKLTHLNIVQVFDFGIGTNNVPYYTMELLTGQSLSERIYRQGRLELADALPIFIAAAEALSHAHNLNIVHRDIKPANIFLSQTAGGKTLVKVVDFGIAKLATVHSYDEQTDTDSGIVFGSPLYMSPEQSMGEATDHRTDIYSYGCSLFEALTGTPPFLGANAFETISMHHHKKPPHLVDACTEMRASQPMERLVARLMEKDVQKRYQSFDQVLADLKRVPSSDLTRSGSKISVPVGGGKTRQLQEDTQGRQAESQEITQGNTGPMALANTRLLYFGLAALALVVVALAAAYYLVVLPHQARSVHSPKAGAAAVDGAIDNSLDSQISRLPQYFSAINPDGSKTFYFPKDMIIGTILIRPYKERIANTIISVGRNDDVEFRPSEVIGRHPELFNKFHKDDINLLNCSALLAQSAPDPGTAIVPWGAHQLDIATQALPGLERLDLTLNEVDGDSIKFINRLNRLAWLVVDDTKITGRDLLKLNRLFDLRYLQINNVKDATVVIRRLVGSHKLKSLKAEDCGLTDADMKDIGRLTGLQGLSLQHNKISARAFKYLLPMTGLENLEIGGEPLGPDMIPLFSTFKDLHALSFTADNWTEAQKGQLQHALPGCKISYKDKSEVMRSHEE